MSNPFGSSDMENMNSHNSSGADDYDYSGMAGDLEAQVSARKNRRDPDFLDSDEEDENEKLILARKCCNNKVSSSSTHLLLAVLYWILAIYLKICCVSCSSFSCFYKDYHTVSSKHF